jgi:hypothetical protein
MNVSCLTAAVLGAAHGAADVSSLKAASCEHRQFILALVFGFLVSDVLPDCFLISSDSRHEITARPEMLAGEVELPRFSGHEVKPVNEVLG